MGRWGRAIPNPRTAIVLGARFGKWTVTAPDGVEPGGNTRWLCRCDCGTERSVRLGTLKLNRSCGGCVPIGRRPMDLTGRVYGMLTVADGRGTVIRCNCECGAVTDIDRGRLMAGKRKSCGCALPQNPPLPADLGMVPDREVAQRMGLSLVGIQKMRKSRGIPSLRQRTLRAWVYFIQCAVTKAIKIGWATDTRRRMTELQTGSASKLSLLVAVSGDERLESALHAEFKHLRLGGEWFRPYPELIRRIDALARHDAGLDSVRKVA